MNPAFWRGKRVFLTGHTGFKGGWLSLWLQSMGAEVHGYALNPPTETNIFSVADVGKGMASSVIADIRDAGKFSQAMKMAKPEIVFHLAAQSLVRYSYAQPAETYEVNVMGTVNLLEAVRGAPGVKAVVNVTTDKCYENQEWVWSYRENEAMGGFDPYSSSKGCAELVTAAYRRSFLEPAGIALASARAGNVIGGGDWAKDRLVTDIVRSIFEKKEVITLRNPQAIRPWQFVLEPLLGYITLAKRLYEGEKAFADAWNFAPDDSNFITVEELVKQAIAISEQGSYQIQADPNKHETNLLKLDAMKSKSQLGWRPRLDINETLNWTFDWYKNFYQNEEMQSSTSRQITEFLGLAGET